MQKKNFVSMNKTQPMRSISKTYGVLCLGLCIVIFGGCTQDSGRIRLGSCNPGEEGACPEGEVCKATAATAPGAGVCMPWRDAIERGCLLGDNSGCKPHEICWNTADTPQGVGTCLPKATCTLGEVGHCQEAETCHSAEGMPLGLGLCIPNEDTPGQDAECPGDEVCNDTPFPPDTGECPEGEGEGDGTCIREVCTAGMAGEEAGCAEDQICFSTEDGKGSCEAAGSCTPHSDEWPCASGVCLDTTGNGVGTCHAAGSCRPGVTGDCSSGDLCLVLAPEAELGTCYSEGHCSLLDGSGCAETESCQNSFYTPELNLGTCVANNCNEAPCPSGWNCHDDDGTCVPNACSAAGEDDECPGAWKCKQLGQETLCILETCLAGETGPEAGCSSGEKCVATDDLKGECMAIENCRPYADGDCAGGELCLVLAPEAELGTCYSEGYCSLLDGSGCEKAESCQNSFHTPELNLGTCVTNNCYDAKCPNGWDCSKDDGICVPSGCSAAGEDDECPGAWKCKQLGKETLCILETCLAGETGKEAGCSSGEKCVATDDLKGECMAIENCRPYADGDCASGELCLMLDPDSELGTCHSEGHCNLRGKGSECGKNESCRNSFHTPELNLGTCVTNNCYEADCPNGWDCSKDDGICVPSQCTTGNDDECPDTWRCLENPMNGEEGICLSLVKCTGDGDCEGGQSCAEIDSDGIGSCMFEG